MSFQISIHSVGKSSSNPYLEIEKNYLKRIIKPWKVEINELNDSKIKNLPAGNKKALGSKLLCESCSSKALFKIALDEKGKTLSTQELFKLIYKNCNERGQAVAFAIGPAEGLTSEFIDQCDISLALSRLTMPHELARLVLIEQIYRCYTLSIGHPYHKT